MDGIGLLVERFVGVLSGVVFLVAVVLMIQLAGCVEFGGHLDLGISGVWCPVSGVRNSARATVNVSIRTSRSSPKNVVMVGVVIV